MRLILDGRKYKIEDLFAEDVIALHRMIQSAKLNERRTFNDLKEQIEDFDNKGFLAK